MDRLEGLVGRRRWVVIGAWLALVVAALPFAAKQQDNLTSGGFSIPGSGSAAVDRAKGQFKVAEGEHLAIVLARRQGAGRAGIDAAIARADRATREVPGVTLSKRAAAGARAELGRSPIAVVPLDVKGSMDDTADLAVDYRAALDPGDEARQGVSTYLVGQQALWAGMQDLTKSDLEQSEATGFPIVLLILLAVFGSLAAASLPLALGLVAVILTGAAIFFLSQAMHMSVFVTNVASMIGIGVAVDYSLFVLARYREEVQAGRDPADARRVAMRTSGIAVAFSGVTVMISLAGLFLVDATTIRSMATGAIIVVAVAILGATTLLPALMSVLGRRAYSRGRLAIVGGLVVRQWRNLRRRPGSSAAAARRAVFWERWTDRVTKRPVLYAAASAALLLVLAIPALSLQTGDGALRQFPKTDSTRVGAELAAKKAGAGAAGPVEVAVRFEQGRASDPANARAVDRYVSRLRRDREVERVVGVETSPDRRSVLVKAVPRHDPESSQARALVSRLREDSGAFATVARVDVGGNTAAVEDFRALVTGSLWKILLFVAAFSYLVLLLLLRSVVLPLKAVLMNLLSVGAAYGILVTVFQFGWFDSIIGIDHLGYINTMTPPFLLAIVFGLSMDYEVFLLTRIRERYDATGDTTRAVAEGLRASAKTISSAALIMVAVFAVFAATGVPSIQEIGLGLAVAIALDATLVRLILVPATMEILGRWNWWLPRRLEKALPRTDFEAGERPSPARA